jgi:peptidoglycan-N-acetylglucosamine deacetylase
MNTRWKPSPTIQASAALHMSAIGAVAMGMPLPWAAAALMTNHALLTAAGLWPRSTLLGANMRCLPNAASKARQVAITIDDGPNPAVTPAVLDILDAAHAKASFFCIGRNVELHPHLARDIIRRGHSIENHSYTHRHIFSLMGMAALRQEIMKGQDAISQATGFLPAYFRAPAGLRSPLLDPVLQDLNLKLVSWTRRGFDTRQKNPAKILSKLLCGLAAGDILLLHDGNGAASDAGESVILHVLPTLLRTITDLELHPIALNCAASTSA